MNWPFVCTGNQSPLTTSPCYLLAHFFFQFKLLLTQSGLKNATNGYYYTSHCTTTSPFTSAHYFRWLSREGTLKLYSEGLLFDSVVWSLDECKPPPEPLNLSSSPSSSTADVDIATGAHIHQIETFPGTEFSVECIGVGMRAKPIMGLVSVNIYTVALYVEREEIKKGLKGGGKSLSSSPLTNELLNGSFRMVAHLDFVRTVGVDNVADGLSSLKGVADEPLAAFRKAIVESVGTEIKARETISLVWLQHSELLVIVRGQIATKIVDSNLPAAVFDLYLGEDPVSLPAKRSFEDGLKKMLP